MVAVDWLAGPGRRSVLVLAVTLVAALTIGTGTSFAAAGPASCMGHEASSISPPGSSDEFPGGMPDLRQFIRDTFPGVPPGAISSAFAKLHAGSHEACDEAFEGEE